MKIGSIILAAGNGSRFQAEQHKLLVRLNGKAIIRYSAEKALQAGFLPVVVVLGYQKDDILVQLQGLPVLCIENPDWQSGQSTSLKKGIDLIQDEVDAACLMLADQPFVSIRTLRKLEEVQKKNPESIIVPTYQGKNGNPTMFPHWTFQALIDQPANDLGGRNIIKQYGAKYVEVKDPFVIRDIDTKEDLIDYSKK